jgi:hypothetical protein
MEKYAPAIHHEASMPNYIKSQDDYSKVWSTLNAKAGQNMDDVYKAVVTALQADFDAANK